MNLQNITKTFFFIFKMKYYEDFCTLRQFLNTDTHSNQIKKIKNFKVVATGGKIFRFVEQLVLRFQKYMKRIRDI